MIDVLASTSGARTVGRQEMPGEANTEIPVRLTVFPGHQAGVDRSDGFSLDPGC